ncbi:MAG TPA: hypothetical protein PLB02_02860 [Thermoanaerobaculia bacterium]|nr:hypothetical protein [Thermoanaerobaculia bacterium]HQR66312.1 hypothetical protein [Thermoanaerobaculia bacterium]
MGLLRRVLGPASKYDRRIPFTYAARVRVAGVEGMVQTYLSDTLCGLLETLDAAGVRPDEPEILEVRPEGEYRVALEHCVGPDGKWLRRPEACESFRKHYAGHVAEGRCCFTDRSRDGTGPIVEVSS